MILFAGIEVCWELHKLCIGVAKAVIDVDL